MSHEITISEGNTQLNSAYKNFRILIFNLPCKTTCIEATNICLENCYASNVNYPNAINSREKNLLASKSSDFSSLVKDEINKYLNINSPNKKITYFRIHESGDFYHIDYLKKWIEIANDYKDQSILFVAYTKSIKLLKSYLDEYKISLSEINIKFIFSIMDDTDEDDILLAHSFGLMTYSALTKEKINVRNYNYECTMGCSNCMYCYQQYGNVVTELR